MNCREDYTQAYHGSPQAFSNYLKNLASLHRCLAHTPEKPHFFRGELEEFFMGFRDRVNFPALIQEGAEIHFTTDEADNAFKERETSFMIVQSYENDNDYDEIYAAFDLCELIGDEIIRKMNCDKYETSCMVIKDFHLEDVTAIQIQNVRERYVGVRYSFPNKTLFGNEIDAGKWRSDE